MAAPTLRAAPPTGSRDGVPRRLRLVEAEVVPVGLPRTAKAALVAAAPLVTAHRFPQKGEEEASPSPTPLETLCRPAPPDVVAEPGVVAAPAVTHVVRLGQVASPAAGLADTSKGHTVGRRPVVGPVAFEGDGGRPANTRGRRVATAPPRRQTGRLRGRLAWAVGLGVETGETGPRPRLDMVFSYYTVFFIGLVGGRGHKKNRENYGLSDASCGASVKPENYCWWT